MRRSATTYQKINSYIVSKGAMNSFKEMFPLARMFPQGIYLSFSYCLFHCLELYISDRIIFWAKTLPPNIVSFSTTFKSLWFFSKANSKESMFEYCSMNLKWYFSPFTSFSFIFERPKVSISVQINFVLRNSPKTTFYLIYLPQFLLNKEVIGQQMHISVSLYSQFYAQFGS